MARQCGLFREQAVDHRSHSLALGARIEWAPWVIGAYIRRSARSTDGSDDPSCAGFSGLGNCHGPRNERLV